MDCLVGTQSSIWKWFDMEMGENRNAMTTRTTSKMVTFARPFMLKAVDRILPAGNYRVVTDEELIQELSFPVYRRVSTMIFVPGKSASSVEMVAIDPQDLQAAQELLSHVSSGTEQFNRQLLELTK